MIDEYYVGIYDFLHEFLVDDIKLYKTLLKEKKDCVLELGCGTGRVMLPLVEDGFSIVGLDIAESMLAVLRRKLETARERRHGRYDLIHGDMRHFRLERKFSAIIIPFNTFLYMHTAEDQRRCLTTAWQHLTADGLMVIDCFNPLPILKNRQPGALVHELTRYDAERKVIFSYFSSYFFDNHFFYWNQFFEELKPTGEVTKQFRLLKFKCVFEDDMRRICENSGFKVEAVLGSYDQKSATADSNNLIFILSKHGGQNVV